MKFDIKTAIVTSGALLTLVVLQGSSIENNSKNFTNINKIKLFQKSNLVGGKPSNGYTDFRKMDDFIQKHPQGFLTQSSNKYGTYYTYSYNE